MKILKNIMSIGRAIMNELRPLILGIAIAMLCVAAIIWLSPYGSQHEPMDVLLRSYQQ